MLVNNILQNAQVGGHSVVYQASDQKCNCGFMQLPEVETLLKLDKNYNSCSSLQERLRRLHHNVAKETARRKTMLEASGVFSSRSPSKP